MRVQTLGSGSSGNALLVRTATTTLLVDAGPKEDALMRALEREGVLGSSVSAIVVTHAHGDHLGCARKLSRKWKAPLFASDDAARGAATLARVKRLAPVEPGAAFAVGDVRVETVRLAHDAPGTVACVIEGEGARFAIATDLGAGSAQVEAALRTCDAFLLEFNHDERWLRDGGYPWRLKRRVLGEEGHLSNAQAAAVLARAAGPRLRRVLLGHLSEKNNSPELALAAARRALDAIGRADVRVDVAPRSDSGPEISL